MTEHWGSKVTVGQTEPMERALCAWLPTRLGSNNPLSLSVLTAIVQGENPYHMFTRHLGYYPLYTW